jgi:hypothetical protein
MVAAEIPRQKAWFAANDLTRSFYAGACPNKKAFNEMSKALIFLNNRL